MSHFLALLFGFFSSLTPNSTTAHNTEPFVPPTDTVNASYAVPVGNRDSLARRSAFNSYSEDACLSSCLFRTSSTNSTSQPQLILRAQR